ncbi:MAG: hypothetical protein IPP44_30805 [Ideonella sp.]|nr:hypothetical protein [Ideonella sp.]
MANSASAAALALTGRTTSMFMRAQASRSMFSEPALRRPTAHSIGALIKASPSSATEAGTIIVRAVCKALRSSERAVGQLWREAHRMTRHQPLHHLGVERFDDQDIHWLTL